MTPLSKIWSGVAVVLVGLFFVPTAFALPLSGVVKGMANAQTGDALALSQETTLNGLVKNARYGIRIGYGGYYPRHYGYRSYGYYPRYRYRRYSRRHYSPYRYRSYRAKRRYKRRYKRRRTLRRLRRSLRHRLYY